MGLRSLSKVVAALSLLTIAAGCASQETVQALREPSLPPVAVLKAEQGGKLYRNISIQEIEGAPEFRWFDGGAVLTTRPTRRQVQDRLTVLLDRADLTAPSRLDSTYMLYVKFDDLHGPDMWVGSDKLATARIHFRLVEWRTGKLVKEKTVEASYRVKWAGVTPEMARSAIAGPIGVADDSPFKPIGGAVGGVVLGFYINENLAIRLPKITFPELYGAYEGYSYAGLDRIPQFNDAILTAGLASLLKSPRPGDIAITAAYGAAQATDLGGPDKAVPGSQTALAAVLAVATKGGQFSRVQDVLAGGLASGASAAAGSDASQREVAADVSISGLNGSVRRLAATRGLLDLAFDEFMVELTKDGEASYKTAVSCRSLNPQGARVAIVVETDTKYGIDCPGSSYNESYMKRAPVVTF